MSCKFQKIHKSKKKKKKKIVKSFFFVFFSFNKILFFCLVFPKEVAIMIAVRVTSASESINYNVKKY